MASANMTSPTALAPTVLHSTAPHQKYQQHYTQQLRPNSTAPIAPKSPTNNTGPTSPINNTTPTAPTNNTINLNSKLRETGNKLRQEMKLKQKEIISLKREKSKQACHIARLASENQRK
eukprot:Pgem_evm1s19635